MKYAKKNILFKQNKFATYSNIFALILQKFASATRS